MRHVEVERVQRVFWECDHCGDHFQQGRKKPACCSKCGKDLCKKCKRHIHVEIGTGNGHPCDHQMSQTKDFCPECYVSVAETIKGALGGDT
jgi:hypothetical protein